MMNNFLISIIVPCYNEAENIFLLISKIEKTLAEYKYEIVLVNDGSTDNTAQIIALVSQKNKNIKYIYFSRNFGHQAAIKAGIDYAKGDCLVTMDADLQHPPETILKMISLWKKGFEVITATRKKNAKISFLKKWFSKSFYWFLSTLSDQEVIVNAADFRLFDKKIATFIRNMPETHLYLRGLFSWIGFKQTTVDYNQEKRIHGSTKYSYKKMISLASNGITSSSIKPLRIALSIGIVFAILAFAYGIYAIVIMFLGLTVSGWTSIIATILFLSGIQLMVLGVMGEYIGKIYIENKQRPHYLISQTNIKIENKTKERITNKQERRAVVF
ncbi:glycosyltransferase family 2 protein [Polaribacter cellanae]|uniref:Glycosyltransferase n=1 Tax=Polaribacter cellanae TaxID=2818493 RepID=A0A975CNA5_9FLAO|nr:glycosyltransferase family 2 protein [Polaribacter cellanae]QTE22222.1 glycosyltransferase [Polaribacter cellanae]